MIAKRNFIQKERERNGAFDGKRPRQAKTARFLPEAQGTKADEAKTRRSPFRSRFSLSLSYI